jgi:ABC-type uncharacterized transport system permease subunit
VNCNSIDLTNEKEGSKLYKLDYPMRNCVSGIIWPIQAVPEWLMYISEALPLTIPTNTLRFIMGRGEQLIDDSSINNMTFVYA